jgi:hypothetical protein
MRWFRNESSDSFQKFVGWGVFHESEAEPFLTQVFDGCSYEIYFFVKDQEAVVRFAECPDFHGWILSVMLVNVQLKLFGNLAGVDCCCY